MLHITLFKSHEEMTLFSKRWYCFLYGVEIDQISPALQTRHGASGIHPAPESTDKTPGIPFARGWLEKVFVHDGVLLPLRFGRSAMPRRRGRLLIIQTFTRAHDTSSFRFLSLRDYIPGRVVTTEWRLYAFTRSFIT